MDFTRIRVDDIAGASPLRAALKASWVAHLIEAGPPFPPVLVTGTATGGRLVDGRHRVAAARALGLEWLDALVVDEADEVEVLIAACRANAVEHVPLATRRRAAMRLLELCPGWSDRRIAVATRIAPTSVGKWRAEMDTCGVHLDTRQGQDGKTYPAPQRRRRRPGWLRRLVRWVLARLFGSRS